MSRFTRRKFLHTSAALLGATIAGSSFDTKKKQLLLSFSTLGCPDWNFQQIADFAAAHAYEGIELRGIQRELDLTKCSVFRTAQSRSNTVSLMKEKELRFAGLGSSATLHFAEGAERNKNIDEGRRFIDLAQQINCPYVRVFPNNFPKDQDRNETMDLIASGLLELGNYANGSKVTVLMETHGDVVKTSDLEKIMQSAEHAHTGLVWDIANMWSVTQEPPMEVYQKLKKYIRHTHIKDGKLADGKLQYTLLGQGEVPLSEAIEALEKGGYKGYYSFEWEKLWHPEIEEPAIALADYPISIQQYF
ncbi:sugar phosphate isomerase/epimerase family protein [Agriterribacter sp.]|uniref:sugar phosphate isomerase/epimerase family protein n=1 Tax=Agriterribacter sp. TaxID=2821509 RepID=UPI002BB677DA|nr:sugar phosphate isomerase/epimerase family protein [Agriterribacter sp.]HRO45440.1 sugar phosphate isomerase/epimerase family protein [Agriterribacter sp.]HRQ19148.1 sugar phosphate isomerase/epimerase family protein [Agriterribacter sp.]